MQKNKLKMSFSARLTECAIMLALATVLSYFKLIDLPYGGSITLFSMLPMVIVSYRHGTLWGLLAGLANGAIQLIFGLSSLSYATSAAAAVAIILLDYIIAFAVTGFCGFFKSFLKCGSWALPLGAAFCCILRYICHVISGCTVWAGVSIPDGQAIIYSLAYNATYMLPELLITVIGAVYISGCLNLEGINIVRAKKQEESTFGRALNFVSFTFLAAAVITDIALIAPKLQNADTGEFDITGIANVDFLTVGIIALCGLLLFAVFRIWGKKHTN